MDNMTAKVSCFARAYHSKMNRVRIFDDNAAGQLLGTDYAQIAQSMSEGIGFFLPGFSGTAEEGLRLIVDRQLSPSVLARSAFCENALQNEIRLGCKQYVIFAAGYDTYALRNQDTTLSVFEADLPEVLADKRKRIVSAGLESCTIDVPCDLSKPDWIESMRAKGFRTDLKTFGSLLGISYYLNKSDFSALISMIGANIPKGSSICFDYPSAEDSREAALNRKLAAGAGEQMKARYGDAEIEKLLDDCGFLIYEHLGATEMNERFFAEYNRTETQHPITAPAGVKYILAVRS